MFQQGLRQGHRWRFRAEHLLVVAVVMVCCVFFSLVFVPRYLNNFFYDSFLNFHAEPRDTDILIVAIDEHSLRELGRWPWDRKIHTELLDILTEAQARQVLFDILLLEPDSQNPEGDQALADAMVRHGSVYLPVHMEQLRTGGQLIELMPFDALLRASAGLGHVDLDLDHDGVVRSFYLRSGVGEPWWPHISLTMLKDQMPSLVTAYPLPEIRSYNSLGNVRAYRRFIDFAGPAGTYPQISYVDVLRKRVPASLFNNRTVMVGATAAGMGDLFPTPMLQGGMMMSGVEINANIHDALKQGSLVVEMPRWAMLGIGLMMTAAAVITLPFLSQFWALPAIIAFMSVTLSLSYGLLALGNYWWPPAATMFSILLSWPIWTWRRLEYSLDFLKSALNSIAEYSQLNHRLGEADSITGIVKMANELLPIESWRLETLGGKTLLSGGDRKALLGLQDFSARNYYFRRREDEYRLIVRWQKEYPTPEYEGWLQAILQRLQVPAPRGKAVYEVVESYIDSVRDEEDRQNALMRFFRTSFSRLQDGILICDSCGSILYANDRALEWFDLREERLHEGHILDLASALDFNDVSLTWPDVLRSAILSGNVQLECHDSRDREVYLGILTIDTGGQPGRVLILSLRDISEVKQALRARSEMLDFMSHDLRSPMISILALIERRRAEGVDQENEHLLGQIQFHAERNLRIAEQFLQLARVESVERIDLNLLDMLPVVESAIDQVLPQAQAREMRVHFHYQDDEFLWVRGNHEMLERLVENLLTNAVKYGDQGSDIQVRLFRADQSVVCEVEDKGMGIAPSQQQRIFERYQRGEATARTRGAGLGLRFVKEVADRHGGTVTLRSQIGLGSCFTLQLPAANPEDEAAEPAFQDQD